MTGACAGSGLGARVRRSHPRLPTFSRVALIWTAPPGHRRAGEAQEGIALLEVAVPSTAQHSTGSRHGGRHGRAGPRVVIGMDPHKRSVTIEVMLADESVVGGGRFDTT